MDYYLSGKYPHRYISNGTENGTYSIGSFWDYSNPSDIKNSSVHFGFMIGEGLVEVIDEGSWDEPPLYEPFEYEAIIVRPRLKYPKR